MNISSRRSPIVFILVVILCFAVIALFHMKLMDSLDWELFHSTKFPIPYRQSNEIFNIPLKGGNFKKLSLMEMQNKNKTIEWTQNYSNICGHSLLNKTQFCTKQLWSIQPDAGDAVPAIVHHILHFSTRTIAFHQAVCMVSAFWKIRPKVMVLWYTHEGPEGVHWNFMVHNLSSHAEQVILMPIKKPTLIYSHKMYYNQHYADVIRLELLYLFGGVYFDLDVVVLKSFKPLFNYSFTIGRETTSRLCNGAMISSRENLLVKRWLMLYQFYKHFTGWAVLSVALPHALHLTLPQHIHVESESLDRPNWASELTWIYRPPRKWNWKEKNYAMHLWYSRGNRLLGVNGTDFESIKHDNSMYGDIFRFIIYGNESLH